MSEFVTPLALWCEAILEVLGIATITLVALFALCHAFARRLRKGAGDPTFQELRQRLGRGMLLGLEFLIAADIIHTVAIELTFESVGVLAAIVLVRTFLSFTLELELTGRWPWQGQP